MKRKPGKRTTTRARGYGYVARWLDGTLGWWLPDHLSGWRRSADHPSSNEFNEGEPAFLCEITIKQVFDKRGRPIVRRIKRTS